MAVTKKSLTGKSVKKAPAAPKAAAKSEAKSSKIVTAVRLARIHF